MKVMLNCLSLLVRTFLCQKHSLKQLFTFLVFDCETICLYHTVEVFRLILFLEQQQNQLHKKIMLSNKSVCG